MRTLHEKVNAILDAVIGDKDGVNMTVSEINGVGKIYLPAEVDLSAITTLTQELQSCIKVVIQDTQTVIHIN